MRSRASNIFSFLYPSWLSHMVVLGERKKKIGAVLHETGSQPDYFKPPGKPGLPSVTLYLQQMILLAVLSIDTGQPEFAYSIIFIPAIIKT